MANIRGVLGTQLAFILLLAVTSVGCTGGSTELSQDEVNQAIADFDYEKGVAGFIPPSWEELNANTKWTDKHLSNALEDVKKELADYQPPVSPAEAEKLKSTTQAEIDTILAAMKIQPKSDDEVDWNGTWVHHVAGDINSLNPMAMSSTADFDVVGLTGIGVINSDINMRPTGNGNVLKSWQVSEDNKLHKFVIRDDLTWSDGQPITAEDWEFTFKVIKHPEMGIYIPALPSSVEKVDYVKAYDDHTFVVFHQEATAVNDWSDEFPILPKHIYYESIALDPSMADSKIHQKMEEKPVVGGPYEVVSRSRGKNVILKRREAYYMHKGEQVREKPYYETIRIEVISDTNTALMALSKGEVDDMIIPAPKWNTDAASSEFYANNVKVSAPEWGEYHVCWNCESVLFKDPKVRQALGYAVDYRELLDRVLDGLFEQANGPYHPGSWMAPKPALPMYTYDLDKARQLLDEAGWKDTDADGIRDKEIGGKKVPFAFTIMRSPTPLSEKVTRVLLNSLSKVGIKVEERQTEFTVLQQKAQDHTFDAMYGGWGAGTDPFYSKNIFGSNQQRNYGQYSNPKVDELYEQGLVELDPEKRAKIYQEIATLIYQDQPYTFLFYPSELHGFNKNMRGYQFSARGPFHYSPGMESLWKVKTN